MLMDIPPKNTKDLKWVQIEKQQQDNREVKTDCLVVEEPLEIRLSYGSPGQRRHKSLAVTMRTPGQDFDLATGFLFTEGIIGRKEDILQIRFMGGQLAQEAQENMLQVDLHPDCAFDVSQLDRHFYTASSCGICGKASIEMVQANPAFLIRPGFPQVSSRLLFAAPGHLLEMQQAFSKTGGLHAAGLFDASTGDLRLLREDVGRHNALDKLIGVALQMDLIPLRSHFLMVSGRLSFELVQKALMAGIPLVAAVGAPSSLAVELAEEYDQTIVGFLKQDQFNLYCGAERVKNKTL